MRAKGWPWSERFRVYRKWLDSELSLSVARRDNGKYLTESKDFYRGQAAAYAVAIDRLFRHVLQDEQQDMFGG